MIGVVVKWPSRDGESNKVVAGQVMYGRAETPGDVVGISKSSPAYVAVVSTVNREGDRIAGVVVSRPTESLPICRVLLCVAKAVCVAVRHVVKNHSHPASSDTAVWRVHRAVHLSWSLSGVDPVVSRRSRRVGLVDVVA